MLHSDFLFQIKRSGATLLIGLISACFSVIVRGQDPKELVVTNPTVGVWFPLFNGKNLDGWTPKIRFHDAGENYANTFRVENGILKVGYEGYREFRETFGHLFYKDTFSKYRLRIEYRFVGEQILDGPGWAVRNSGVMLHGERPESMAKDQDFPASFEVPFLGGDGTQPQIYVPREPTSFWTTNFF